MKVVTLLGEVLHALVTPPATEPLARSGAGRGGVRWDPQACTGCALCVRDCPAQALSLEIVDKTAKHYRLHYDAGRCAFCGQCASVCRFGCLALVEDVESVEDRAALVSTFERENVPTCEKEA